MNNFCGRTNCWIASDHLHDDTPVKLVPTQVVMPAHAVVPGFEVHLVPVQQRPDWDTYFMGIARAASTRATCSRGAVGCVIVDNKHRVVAMGYNGAPPGKPHCNHENKEHRPIATIGSADAFLADERYRAPQTNLRYDEVAHRWTCAVVDHAEQNAISYLVGTKQFASYSYRSLTLYTTHSPCESRCSRLIADVPGGVIGRVVYNQAYNLSLNVNRILDGIKLEAHA